MSSVFANDDDEARQYLTLFGHSCFVQSVKVNSETLLFLEPLSSTITVHSSRLVGPCRMLKAVLHGQKVTENTCAYG